MISTRLNSTGLPILCLIPLPSKPQLTKTLSFSFVKSALVLASFQIGPLITTFLRLLLPLAALPSRTSNKATTPWPPLPKILRNRNPVGLTGSIRKPTLPLPASTAACSWTRLCCAASTPEPNSSKHRSRRCAMDTGGGGGDESEKPGGKK